MKQPEGVVLARSRDEQERNSFTLERTKLAVDVVKHISTLSTGSLVAVTTVINRPDTPVNQPMFLFAAVAFLTLCVMSCALYLLLAGIKTHLDEGALSSLTIQKVTKYTAVFQIIMFSLGLGMLGCFAFMNIPMQM
ncbi:MAG: hypothetical protein U0R19_05355 [Bryobacteraceae bacterium]